MVACWGEDGDGREDHWDQTPEVPCSSQDEVGPCGGAYHAQGLGKRGTERGKRRRERERREREKERKERERVKMLSTWCAHVADRRRLITRTQGRRSAHPYSLT